MSHLNPIPAPKCNRCRTKRARYELINNQSAVIGYYCSPCGLKALYDFQHPKPEGRIGPVATAQEDADMRDAMRKAGL